MQVTQARASYSSFGKGFSGPGATFGDRMGRNDSCLSDNVDSSAPGRYHKHLLHAPTASPTRSCFVGRQESKGSRHSLRVEARSLLLTCLVFLERTTSFTRPTKQRAVRTCQQQLRLPGPGIRQPRDSTVWLRRAVASLSLAFAGSALALPADPGRLDAPSFGDAQKTAARLLLGAWLW